MREFSAPVALLRAGAVLFWYPTLLESAPYRSPRMLDLAMSIADRWALVLSFLLLLGLIGLAEGLRSVGVAVDRTRSMVHVAVCLFVATTPLVFSNPIPVYGLAAAFVVVNAAARSQGWWAGIHAARSDSWGTVTLPLAVVPALAATWSVADGRIFILQTAFVLLGSADPLASIAGDWWGRRTMVGDATWIGSLVFFGSSAVITGAGLLATRAWSPENVLAPAAGVALVAAAAEAVSRRGWDNLSIILAVVLVMTPLHEGMLSLPSFGFGLLVAIAFGASAWWVRALDPSGAVGGGLFAAMLVALGGWAWAAPGFVFFLLSSALSQLPGEAAVSELRGERESDGRTIRQVLANGGVAWGLLSVSVVLAPEWTALRTSLYVGFLGALATAAADTWATEVGSRMSSRPRLLHTLEPVHSGTSGAVSLIGTLAAIAGAASVAGASAIAGGAAELRSGLEVALIVTAGGAGMLVDSLAGATVEGANQGPRGTTEVEPSETTVPVRGGSRIDNEVVNLIGTSAGAAVAVLLFLSVR